MKWTQKHLAIAIWIGALVIMAGAMLIFESDQLWKVQEKNLFLCSSLFLKEQLTVPGGLLTWIGTWFTQFLYYPWLGVSLLCSWWLLLMALTKKTFHIPDRWSILMLIPIAILLISNMGMVCTNDLVKDYEYWAIHPCMKKEIGDRLCYWALGDTYEIPGIDYRYPEYQSMEIKDEQVILTFKNAESGFNRKVGIEGFEIAGTDSVWHKASTIGVYDENKISVKCKEVKNPLAVRYCFQSWSPGNLKGNSGLPVIPFRTDNWPR